MLGPAWTLAVAVAFTTTFTVALGLPAPRAARAQPMMGGGGPGGGMPDMRVISGRALPDAGMPAGTVSVRVVRKMPSNPVADVEIVALIKNAGGDMRKRTAKTDASGRAMLESVVAGDVFHIEVRVDGEKLTSDEITMPPSGGVRMMLVAGLGPAPAGGGAGAGAGAGAGGGAPEDDFSLGASTGKTTPDPALPDKTLIIKLTDEEGKPIPSHDVMLGVLDANTSKLDVRRAKSDAEGTLRFADLATGTTVGYAAVMEWKGLRIGTEPFSMPDKGGARAEIKALARTSDPAVITIGANARVILQLQEDALQFLEIFPLENSSDKLFDPGPGAVEIPLPQGFVGAQTGESARKLEVRQNHGIAVHGAITPKRMLAGADARSAGNEVTFGFVLPYQGDTREMEQTLPNGIGPFAVITEQLAGLSVSGPGVGAREARELGGKKYWVSQVEGIPAGGVLKLTVSGLPSTDSTGRWVSGALALALGLGCIAFARRPSGESKRAADSERERLTARRETLFAELVAVDRAARQDRAGGGGGGGDGRARRAGLVSELEGVYQQLAALDEQRAL